MIKLIISLLVLSTIFYFVRHFIGAMFGLYRIVPVNEAHIRILKNSKKTFSSRLGKKCILGDSRIDKIT